MLPSTTHTRFFERPYYSERPFCLEHPCKTTTSYLLNLSNRTVQSLVLVLCLLIGQSAIAHERTPGFINVGAEGSATANPDQASFNLSFSHTEMDSDQARKQVDRKVEQLLSDLERFDLKERSLDSSQVQIYPQYRYLNNERQFTGYQVERKVQFILSNLDQLDRLLKIITKTKSAQLNPIQFGLSDPDAVRQDAIAKAIEQSKRLAGKIASSYGVELGPIHSVELNSNNAQAPVMMRAMSAVASFDAKESSPSYQQKELEFKAQIQTSFTFH